MSLLSNVKKYNKKLKNPIRELNHEEIYVWHLLHFLNPFNYLIFSNFIWSLEMSLQFEGIV